ncbi:MAG: hypothetical protein JST40_06810 [Armatimonadetes bacterium]|nr:hypothetical protein [Armatimonadota bacterium]
MNRIIARRISLIAVLAAGLTRGWTMDPSTSARSIIAIKASVRLSMAVSGVALVSQLPPDYDNAFSRELTVGYVPPDSDFASAWSRELTIGYDPEKPYYAHSREVSLGGNATYTVHLDWLGIDPSIIPSTLDLEIRDPSHGEATTTQTITLVDDSFTLPMPWRIKQISFQTGKFLRMSPIVDCRAGDVEVTLVPINGDIDNDNSTTIFDYLVLSDYFDKSSNDPDWLDVGLNGFAPWEADLDGDQAITIFDYLILSENFDKTGDD